MGYSIKHLRIDSKHILALIDDHTTLPSLFVAIYSVRRLSLLRFRTQEKELFTLKYFFEYWDKKFSRTFDCCFINAGYNIVDFIPELNIFYHYLLNKQHHKKNQNNSNFYHTTLESRKSNAEHLRTIAKFFLYLNQRYMIQRYQQLDNLQLCKIRDWNERNVKLTIREFSKVQSQNMSMHSAYRSLTKDQLIKLENILLPSSPLIKDELVNDSSYVNMKKNEFNPFGTLFLQFRTYLIHRLMFNYGLRISEVLLLTTESIVVTKPNSHGEINYILSINNLPSYIKDPRKEPLTIKNNFSIREVLLDEKDYFHIKYYTIELRNPLFNKNDTLKFQKKDSRILFVSNRGCCNPITYDTVQKYYEKIESHFSYLYPDNLNQSPHTSRPKITPHVGRHSWAYLTLEYIYKKLLSDELSLHFQYGIESRLNGLLDAASEQLRNLGGWSLNSRMPFKYAKRFISELANENNLRRVKSYKNLPSLTINSKISDKYDPFL
ncbi:hypothetical protein ABN249_05075 [Providencia rettgeri]